MAPIVLAFSGGLDTSYCVLRLKEEHQADVITVCVNTGGYDSDQLAAIEERARALGAARHVTVDGRQEVFDRFIRYLIAGNVLRGETYPISVAAERVVQAERVAAVAREAGARAVAHGSTGAGNDQVRFDAAFAVLLPGLPILAPIRSGAVTRAQSTACLRQRGFGRFIQDAGEAPPYSVNPGLWGATIGGREIHDPWTAVPDEVYDGRRQPLSSGEAQREVVLGFEGGVPRSLDGQRLTGVRLIEEMRELARPFGIGRGVHIGDTILGFKGRVAFEAPAPLIIIEAHRELEKLVLTKEQLRLKRQIAATYGDLLHEGRYYDPCREDIESYLRSTQRHVTGEARVRLRPGGFDIAGLRSPDSLLARQGAIYGEEARGFSGADAAGFARIWGLTAQAAQARRADAPARHAPETEPDDARR